MVKYFHNFCELHRNHENFLTVPLSTGLDNLKSQNVMLCYVISFTATGYKFKIYELATYIEGHRYMHIQKNINQQECMGKPSLGYS